MANALSERVTCGAYVREIEFLPSTINEIARGDFSVVYQALCRDDEVAVKLYYKDLIQDETDFHSMVASLKAYNHSNIVRVLGHANYLDDTDNTLRFCIVMEKMHESLSAMLARGADMEWTLRWQLALDMVSGVAYLHSQGISHGGIMSDNILVDYDNRAKLANVNTGQLTNTFPPTARSWRKRAWQAPEIFEGDRPTTMADMYSVGVVMWEIATGQQPFAQAPDADTIFAHILSGDREGFPETTPEVFASLSMHQCNTDPAQRMDSSNLMAVILSENNVQVRPPLPTYHLGKTVPVGFVCAITREVMRDPVVTSDGHSYERTAIERWFASGRRTSPRTNVAISTSVLPNIALRQVIEDYFKAM